jgi:hypothetical protein
MGVGSLPHAGGDGMAHATWHVGANAATPLHLKSPDVESG